jgi:hypothetical protein
MSYNPDNYAIEPYSARITVTFDGAKYPFTGRVYNQGDGSHAVFHWPTQPNTKETTELAEFTTQTKWVTTGGKCVKADFADDDPKFVCMVSHKGYKRVCSDGTKQEYLSPEGVRAIYTIDEKKRLIISSIEFKGGRIEFDDVKIQKQDAALFVKP